MFVLCIVEVEFILKEEKYVKYIFRKFLSDYIIIEIEFNNKRVVIIYTINKNFKSKSLPKDPKLEKYSLVETLSSLKNTKLKQR